MNLRPQQTKFMRLIITGGNIVILLCIINKYVDQTLPSLSLDVLAITSCLSVICFAVRWTYCRISFMESRDGGV